MRTRRSRLTTSGTFFGAAMVALAAVSAQPRNAAAFAPDDCPGERGDGPLCMTVEYDYYCTDLAGNPYLCERVTEYYYSDKEDSDHNQG